MADGVPCSRHMSCLGGHGRVGQVIFSLRNAPLPSSPKFCHARAPRRRFDTAHTCSTISIIGLNLSDTHSLRSRYGQCGRRAWRGPGGSPRALGIQLQLAAPRASSPPSSNAVARGRDSLAPHAEPRADLSGALAQQRVACAVEGAVILLCRERGDAGHAGTPRSPRRC